MSSHHNLSQSYLHLQARQALFLILNINHVLRLGAASGKEGRNLDHFCFRVDPFDELNIRLLLKSHGFEIGAVALRYGAEGEGQSMYITDPEGNVVELKGAPIH